MPPMLTTISSAHNEANGPYLLLQKLHNFLTQLLKCQYVPPLSIFIADRIQNTCVNNCGTRLKKYDSLRKGLCLR